MPPTIPKRLDLCDEPTIEPSNQRLPLSSSGLISDRTRKALAAAKARGVRLGGPNGAAPLRAYIRKNGNSAGVQGAVSAADSRDQAYRAVVESLVADGMGNTEIAETLNGRGERSVRGGAFTATSIRRLRARLKSSFSIEPLRSEQRRSPMLGSRCASIHS